MARQKKEIHKVEMTDGKRAGIDPIIFIDAIHFSVRHDNIITKLVAYIVMGINEDGAARKSLRLKWAKMRAANTGWAS